MSMKLYTGNVQVFEWRGLRVYLRDAGMNYEFEVGEKNPHDPKQDFTKWFWYERVAGSGRVNKPCSPAGVAQHIIEQGRMVLKKLESMSETDHYASILGRINHDV
jgi:hypothetical protein